jgi:cyclohexa-1,5-dienecarbonyl-CoA hydratase
MSQVRTDVGGGVATLTLDRPPLNILTIAMLRELAAAVRASAVKEGVRALVLRGEGKGFSAGVDVREHLPETIEPMLAAVHEALTAVLDAPVPVVAAVHGPCLGGGMELAMAADFVYAADTATFGQPEIQLGVFPPFAAALYPGWFGRARAAELILLGEAITAPEAFARGLVAGVMPGAELAARVEAVCAKLAALSPSSLRLAREALRLGASEKPAALAAVEALYRDQLMKTEDAREGLAAFLEKRSPKWRGR